MDLLFLDPRDFESGGSICAQDRRDRHGDQGEVFIDTGLTIAHLMELLQTRNPRSIRVAALLDKLMHRRIRKPRRIMVQPLHVVTRRSTDVVALEDRVLELFDPMISEALMHEQRTQGIDLLGHLHGSQLGGNGAPHPDFSTTSSSTGSSFLG